MANPTGSYTVPTPALCKMYDEWIETMLKDQDGINGWNNYGYGLGNFHECGKAEETSWDTFELIGYLVQHKGVDINKSSAGGDTPLMHACHAGRRWDPRIKCLLKNGADIMAKNPSGETVFSLGSYVKQELVKPEYAQFYDIDLVRNMKDPDWVLQGKRNILHYLAMERRDFLFTGKDFNEQAAYEAVQAGARAREREWCRLAPPMALTRRRQ